MICDIHRIAPPTSDRPGESCGLRRLSEIMPEIMARYDLRLVAEPRRELGLCSIVSTTLDAAAVAS